MKYFRYLFVILIIFLMTGLLMTGCSGGKEAEKKPSSSSEKAEMPTGLKSIRTELDQLIMELEQTAQILSCGDVEQSSTAEQQSSGGGEDKGTESEKQPQEEKEEQQSSDTQDTWSKIAERVKKIHQNWNDVESAAVKEGLSTDTRDRFEQALEELTIQTDKKIIEGSLFAALDVYRYYPDMVDLFESKIPAEYFRLKYEIMLIKDQAGRENWEEALIQLPEMQDQWDVLKKEEAIKDEEITRKTENSIIDFKTAVEKKEACLVQVKSEIVMANMDEIEKKLNNTMQ